jgi:hypothetical protein
VEKAAELRMEMAATTGRSSFTRGLIVHPFPEPRHYRLDDGEIAEPVDGDKPCAAKITRVMALPAKLYNAGESRRREESAMEHAGRQPFREASTLHCMSLRKTEIVHHRTHHSTKI